jgi:methylated-DNA-protein-cysteine methyltransferase-like protein
MRLSHGRVKRLYKAMAKPLNETPQQGGANFKNLVEALVAQIPRGRVMTYGQLAALCGNARSARIVGGIAHFGDPDLPWQRVVNKKGGLASGYPGGRSGHKQVLEAEGIIVDDKFEVNVAELLWWPPKIN